MIKKYRKKPVVIEAIQFTGDNVEECQALRPMTIYAFMIQGLQCLSIPTLEGRMRAEPGDFIIKGINGEVYPCMPDIFEKTYEEVQ